jgi:phosphohistidine phosphatase SixA
MRTYLIRHAAAVPGPGWEDADGLRPLDERGRQQAQLLVDQRDWSTVEAVLSSPVVRCRETVRPLADRLGLPVTDEPLLAEGSDPSRTLGLIEQSGPGDLVLCSHGDLIPEIVRLLHLRGVALPTTRKWQKGSTWVIDHRDDRFVAAAYEPPPDR